MRTFLVLSLVLAAAVASAQNLVVNGDFSAGRTGYTTDIPYNPPATNALGTENVYTLTTNTRNPYNLDTLGDPISDLSDHTTGTGLFMIVNGATTFNSLVWQETLSGLTVGQSYRFSGWVSRWTPNPALATAKLQVLAGNTLVTSFEDPGVGGIWAQHSALFTATSTSVTLQIRDLETAAAGNDFGLDDLSVQAVPEPTALAALGLGFLGALRLRRPIKR